MSLDPGATAPADRTGSLRSRVELGTAVVALITALISGIFGLTAHQAKTQAQDQAATSNQKVEVAASRLSDLQKQLAQAQQQVNDLQGQLSDPASTGTTGGESGSTVFHSGILNLPSGYGADLDAPATDPQWGAGLYPDGVDIDWDNPYSGTLSGGDSVIIQGPATYQNCRTTTGYSDEGIGLKYLDAGTHICVKTSEDRYSIVTVRKSPVSGGQLQLKIVTYTSTD